MVVRPTIIQQLKHRFDWQFLCFCSLYFLKARTGCSFRWPT